jgi:hypothetical protein
MLNLDSLEIFLKFLHKIEKLSCNLCFHIISIVELKLEKYNYIFELIAFFVWQVVGNKHFEGFVLLVNKKIPFRLEDKNFLIFF